MTQLTLSEIHIAYVDSLKCSKDILSITKCLYEQLLRFDIPEEDRKQFDLFLVGLDGCIRHRERTNEFTSLVDALITAIVYIIIFMNNRKSKNWDIDLRARRKSLERDLAKILRKALANKNTCIRDRFGACIVLLNENDFSKRELLKELHDISDAIQSILCSTDRQLRKEFCEFISEIENPLIKFQTDVILNLPFIAEFFKDYINDPKEQDGYQSIHLCLRVDSAAEYFAGAVMELQIRSKTMNDRAMSGDWNHREYEEKTSKEVAGIFHIPNELFPTINVVGFTSYESNVGDMDGIGSAKFVVCRRVSASLIPKYK